MSQTPAKTEDPSPTTYVYHVDHAFRMANVYRDQLSYLSDSRGYHHAVADRWNRTRYSGKGWIERLNYMAP